MQQEDDNTKYQHAEQGNGPLFYHFQSKYGRIMGYVEK